MNYDDRSESMVLRLREAAAKDSTNAALMLEAADLIKALDVAALEEMYGEDL